MRGVVICSAHGVEELCTHRFMRHLADKLAAAGTPALRFDYQGTGDSAGSDADIDRVQSWLKSIAQAVAYLKRTTGVSEVALIGFRMGSLLAAQFALQTGDICKLALLGPVVSGKAYAREMKALGLLIGQATRMQSDNMLSDADDVVAAGFTMTSATKAELQKFDLLSCTHAPAAEIFIAGRPAAPADERLVNHLRRFGCNVQHEVLPGYAELRWDTSFATLPDNAFDAVVSWISSNNLLSSTTAEYPHESVIELRTADWVEKPVQFGPENRLFGVLCEPLSTISKEQKKLVLFVNHGANPHTGWARMHVKFARYFAPLGIASLRIDIAGVGDSPAHPPFSENELYARRSQQDVYAAIDWCHQYTEYRSIALIGHCAGAHLSFYSALKDDRVRHLIMLNLQRFFWPRGLSVEVVTKQTFRSSGWYWQEIKDPKIWRRLFTGKINVTGIATTLTKRVWKRSLSMIGSVLSDVFGIDALNSRVVRWLRDLSVRGTRVLLVYSAEDAGLDEIVSHAGANGRKVANLPNVTIKIIEGADHNMTSEWSQEKYKDVLKKFLVG